MQNRFTKRVLLTAAFAGLSFAAARANAALTITLQEGALAPVTYTDAGTGTLSNFITYGTFDVIDLEVAVSNKTQPAQSQATLQITAIVEGRSPGGPLIITTSDNGFTFPGVNGSTGFMDSSIGGTLAPITLNDKVTFQSTATATSGVAASNVSTGLQTYIAPGSATGTVGFQMPDASTFFIRGSSFDLTNQIQITTGTAFEQANVSGTTTVSLVQTRVPEPTGALAMIAGAGALTLGRRRRLV